MHCDRRNSWRRDYLQLLRGHSFSFLLLPLRISQEGICEADEEEKRIHWPFVQPFPYRNRRLGARIQILCHILPSDVQPVRCRLVC